MARTTRAPPSGVDLLDSLLWHTIENSLQFDTMIELLKQLVTTLQNPTVTQTIELAEKQPVNSVNLQVLQPVERPSAKLQKALDWFAAHPERVGETSRALAAEIGVSHTTVAKSQQLIKQEYR
ncbi:MAG: hypothetical protein LCI00_02175 [Chloroflexi bacterium]|nr:hypothetical protein [Chloroflexota bacterium]